MWYFCGASPPFKKGGVPAKGGGGGYNEGITLPPHFIRHLPFYKREGDSVDNSMIILNYKKSEHKKIIHACILALKQGKVVAYPTDTSYGLAVDASNIRAIKKLYQVKGREFNKAVSVVVPSISYAKKIAKWGKISQRLVKSFWPGALTLVLECRIKNAECRILSAKSYFLGLRMPDNKIALDLSNALKKPITATSANVAGLPDCYSAEEIIAQYKDKNIKPDIIINAGKLKNRKPSTVVKVNGENIEILREGPISKKQIEKVLGVRL